MLAGSDLPWKLSVKTGATGNSTAGTPGTSLGRFISTTAWDQSVLTNNLYDNVTGDENAAMESEYRCVFAHNTHATLTLELAVVHIESQVSGGADVTIGLDPTANSLVGSGADQAVSVATEDTAPAGVVFTGPTTRATGLSLGSLAPGYCRAVWVKRTTTNSAPKDDDGFELSLTGDSAE